MTPRRGEFGSFLIGVLLGCAAFLLAIFGFLAVLGGGKR